MKEPQIPADLWVNNLVDAAELIANREYQESRWLAADAYAWETPDEAINVLGDCVLDGFIEQFAESFTPAQADAVIALKNEVGRYSEATPQCLDPKDVLADPAWRIVQEKASIFVQAFKGRWPSGGADNRHS